MLLPVQVTPGSTLPLPLKALSGPSWFREWCYDVSVGFYRFLVIATAMQAAVIAATSAHATKQAQNGLEEKSASEIQSLRSDIQQQKSNISRWNNATIAFVTLAFLAAGGLVVTSFGLKHKNKILEDAQDQLASAIEKQNELDSQATALLIADASAKAAAAETKTEGFRLNIAEANRQAEEAKERAAQANLELAKFKAPRTLSPEQQKRVSDNLKLFAGAQFDMALNTDPESQDLLPQIEDALKASGWDELDWSGGDLVFKRAGRPVAGIVVMTGVIVQMHPDEVPVLRDAAAALASALSMQGISARAEPGLGTGITNNNPKAIHILVGKKP